MAENLTVYLGRRGCGKSTLAAVDALRIAEEDVLCVIHDPLKGAPVGIAIVCGSLAAVRFHSQSGRVVVAQGVPLETLVAWMRTTAPKMPNGMLLTIDEGVLLTTAEEPNVVKRRIRELAMTARHRKLRLAIVAQGANLIDYPLVSSADRACVFAMSGQYERQKLIACDIPPEVVAASQNLPDHEYFCGVPGRPVAEWNHYRTRVPTATRSTNLLDL